MLDRFRKEQFAAYAKARDYFIDRPEALIELEEHFAERLYDTLLAHLDEIRADYDEASYLYPFWQQYPPDDRGRQPRRDQFPWIEVGEHAIGDKLPRLFEKQFSIRDAGLPTGPDKRFIVSGPVIKRITGLTSSAWLFVDIKSVGPRDDADHTVMSHNQISGDGVWNDLNAGVENSVMRARGSRTEHDFHCSIPPLYVLSDSTVVPVVLMAVKPVYGMENLKKKKKGGQPLSRIGVISIPNGILMEVNPGYLEQHPGLLYPGKDDKGKNPEKVRCRISFELLRAIAPWRVKEIHLEDA